MKKMFVGVSILLALGLSFGQPAVAAPNPPEDVNFTLVLPAGAVFGHCAFDVELTAIGKTKIISLPGGAFIVTSPGFDVTLTNLDSGKQVTLNVTGSLHQTTEANGDVVYVVTGRNL